MMLYHPQSDHSRMAEEYAHDYQSRRNQPIELLSVDSRDGAATASLYDITSYPALLVIRGDGQLQTFWQGGQLPLMNELSGYAEA